jgi:DNA-binding FrmR family transcriptional regulator
MSGALDTCISELQRARDGALHRLAALQTYLQQSVTEETRQWLGEQISPIRVRISTIDGAIAALQAMLGEGYPSLLLAEPTEDVRVNLEAIRTQVSQHMQTMAEAMNTVLPSEAPKAVESTGRRGRAENHEGTA